MARGSSDAATGYGCGACCTACAAAASGHGDGSACCSASTDRYCSTRTDSSSAAGDAASPTA